ncbi:MAG: VWA domain-containing protein [Candidatus Korobacteraceae bacterium]
MFRAFKLLFVITLAVVCFADSLTYMRIDRSVIEKRIQTVPPTDKDKVDTIRAQFKAAGCPADQIQEQAVPDLEVPNIICTLPGPDPGAIVIATQLESKAHGDEALVDWGSVAMLPLLAESLNSAPHRETLVLAAFAGHDRGVTGANWYLKQLTTDQRAQITAMIQIEQVGRTPAAYAFPGPDSSNITSAGRRQAIAQPGHEATTLSKVLPIAARSLKVPDDPKQINDIPATAARVFDEANIPAIVIHSASYVTITPPGKVEQVRLMRTTLDPQVYTDTYNLLCVYTLYLDKVYSLARSKALAAQTAKAGTPPNTDATAAASQPGATSPAANATLTASASAPPGPAAESHVQQPPPGEASSTNPVFRTTTRLVQVDVVVTNKQGRPIPNLTQADFTVLQDGKPQQVHVFEPHTGTTGGSGSAAAANAPKLPANTYSNHPNDATADSWTIVLFDVLNTPTADQEYARKQLLALLRNAPKGQPIALYLLASKLVMVQGFTDDPDKLLKSAEGLKPNRSHVLTTEAERQHTTGQIAYAAAELTESAPGSSTTSDTPIMQQMTQGKQQQMNDLESFQINDRANYTLAAFESLSRAVSGYPGRKNLIWLSTSFPVQLWADPKNDSQPWRNTSNFQSVLATASSLLAKSRIAVYPVDVRGLQGRGVDISNSATEAGNWTSGPNSQNYGDLLAQQASVYSDERATMKQVAEQTGGEAFVGTNDLKRAMQRTMEDGETYYTLAYTPDKVDPQSAFHRIEVKVNQPDAKLAYRRGYYSSLPQSAASLQTGVAALRGALQPGMPPSTMLFLTARVLPPDAEHKDVRITYIVNANSVTFADVAKGKHITLDCITIAFDKDGKEVGHASNTLDGTIRPEAYDTVVNNGIPAQQEITLPPGAYNLHLGVMDRPSQQIGTLDVPLVVPAVTSAQK